METVLANVSALVVNGPVRRERRGGRDYIVANLVLIVPGVLHGSKGALYYPPDECARNPTTWNGMPLVVEHPTRDGVPISARDPEVSLGESVVGALYRSRFQENLSGEGWFDVERTAAYDRRLPDADKMLPRLEKGVPIEISTGLWTDNFPVANGRCPKTGREYTAVARNYRPDHVAILPQTRGACSVADGCGVNMNEATCTEFACNCGGKGGTPGPCKGWKKGGSTGALATTGRTTKAAEPAKTTSAATTLAAAKERVAAAAAALKNAKADLAALKQKLKTTASGPSDKVTSSIDRVTKAGKDLSVADGNALGDSLAKSHTASELKEIAHKITGVKTKGKDAARREIVAHLTETARMRDSQRV